MVRPLMTDTVFLAQKASPLTPGMLLLPMICSTR